MVRITVIPPRAIPVQVNVTVLRFTAGTLVIWEPRQAFMMRRIIVPKDQRTVGLLIVVTVHALVDLVGHLDEFAEV